MRNSRNERNPPRRAPLPAGSASYNLLLPLYGYFRRNRGRDDRIANPLTFDNVIRAKTGKKICQKRCAARSEFLFCLFNLLLFFCFLVSVVVVVALGLLVGLQRKPIPNMRRFRLKNLRFDGKRARRNRRPQVPMQRLAIPNPWQLGTTRGLQGDITLTLTIVIIASVIDVSLQGSVQWSEVLSLDLMSHPGTCESRPMTATLTLGRQFPY